MKATLVRSLGFALLFIASLSPVYSQDSVSVQVRGYVKHDVIRLRWAVSTAAAWKQSNQYGFRVERYTIMRDGKMLPTPDKVVLTAAPLKPRPLADWQELATANNFAAVIAQALYGEDFTLSDEDSRGVSRFIALAQEQEQRFLISLYAADLCYPAALLAGWGYEDRTAKPRERYLYRVIPVVPAQKVKFKQGAIYIGLRDTVSLPKPQELAAIPGDRSVLLSWNYGLLESSYNAYFLEKSLDGKKFQRLSEVPMANMNSKNGRGADRMFYTDSLANNAATVYYRLVGVNAFSEEGPPSDVVQTTGRDHLVYVPHIERAIPDSRGVLQVSWSFDERGNDKLKAFELQRADHVKGPYVTVVRNIDAQQRTISYDSMRASNYFVIAAVSRTGDVAQSFPILVQPSDTVPPSVPTGLKGTVDSLGVVRLSWNGNTEADLLGYRIYRAQTEGEELVPLTDKAITRAEWVDTVNVRNLNSTVYYSVTALDKRYNQSALSARVRLAKPDLVPPTAPLITQYNVKQNGIALVWATGNEQNLAEVRLYRALRGAKKADLLQTFQNRAVNAFTDSTVQSDEFYSYSLVSVTQGGLVSVSSPVVTVQAASQSAAGGKITSFTVKANRKTGHVVLAWTHTIGSVKQIEVYRADASGAMTLWKVVKGFEPGMEDERSVSDMYYEYAIRVLLTNGKTAGTARVSIGKKVK